MARDSHLLDAASTSAKCLRGVLQDWKLRNVSMKVSVARDIELLVPNSADAKIPNINYKQNKQIIIPCAQNFESM